MTTPAPPAWAGRCARCQRCAAPLGFSVRLAPLPPRPALQGATVQPLARQTPLPAWRAAAGATALQAQRPARSALLGRCSPPLRVLALPQRCAGLWARAARCSSPAPLPLPASRLPPTALQPLGRSALPTPWGPAAQPRPPASSLPPAWAPAAAQSQLLFSSLASPALGGPKIWQCHCSAPSRWGFAACALQGPLLPAALQPARSARKISTPPLQGASACPAQAALSPPLTGSLAAAPAPRRQSRPPCPGPPRPPPRPPGPPRPA